MRHTTHLARSAPIAIAAMLALGTIPAVAQNGSAATQQPVIVLPPTAADAPPAPVLQLPVTPTVDATVAPPIETESAEQITDTSPVASARPEPVATRGTPVSAVERQAPADGPGELAASVSTPSTPPMAADPVMAAAIPNASPLPVETRAQPGDVSAARDWTGLIALALAGIIPLGFAIFAFMWWRRRSLRTSHVPVDIVEQPMPRSSVTAASVPVVDHAPYAPVNTSAVASPVPVVAMSSKQSRASGDVVLPRELPTTFAERDKLLRQLVAAKPDRANPFKAPRARARRARLIMQSLGRKFDEASPRFDLSQYAYLWPNLAKPQRGFA